MRDIGKNIRELRMEKHMTQDELAEKLFVTRQTVSNYEVGKSRPDVETLVKIGEILNVDIHELIYGPALKPDKKRMYIRLGVGLGVTIFLSVLYIWLTPVALELRSKHFLTGLNAFLRTVVLPLMWLFFGWTAAQGVANVLGKLYEPPKWATPVKWAILGLLLVYFVPVGWYGIGLLWMTADALHALAAHQSYSGGFTPPQWVSTMIRIFFDAKYTFHISENMGLFSLPGIALWLCGFPKSK